MSAVFAKSLGRAELSELLPHTGDMCLLDAVERWDDDEIVCSATSHRDVTNPLRSNGTLPAVCGVEYAAQAMGIHGRLVAGKRAKPAAGYLVSLRDLVLHVDRLDKFIEPLSIRARRLADNIETVMCEFEIGSSNRPIVTGRATLLLEAP